MRKQWIGLAVLALPTLLVSLDVFVLLLAMPRLSADLHASSTEQLWILDVYGFLLSGFMITMGTLGDRIGRRRLLLIGALCFGVASVVAAYSTSPEMLIAARAVLGVAGATLAPSTLALISTMFPDPRQRALAIGVWMMCFMGGAIIGPLAGGLLLAHFWWGSAFLLGVPAMAVLLVAGPLLLPEHRNPDAGRLDLPSVALSLAAILPVVYGLKELARGFGVVPAVVLLLGLAVGVVFVRRQRALADPLLDLRLFGSVAFRTAVGGMFLGTLLTGAMMVFITQHLQLVKGLSPAAAGLWTMPAVIVTGLSFQLSPLLARRVHRGRLIGGGLLVSVAGLLLVTQAPAAGSPLLVALAFAVINLGMGPLVTLATDIIVGSAPVERAGAAASLNETSGEFGYALGIAALGSLGTAVYRATIDLPPALPPSVVADASDTVTAATSVASTLPAGVGEALLHAARVASTTGMHVVAAVAAALLFGLAVLVLRTLRHLGPLASTPAAPSAEGEAAAVAPGTPSAVMHQK
ncbi:MFS transporter [Dactylosporangium sp. AC04546]|uniref:MFS transporter n=1 Tax=Dactylosporangium sp. AC04546 TaxID=2862460 RepID=UPI002E7B8C62|nr:MFS transporter [Dactylosporangium sp. AC04546]WVK89339.1 MFS transporter [Dactylosporangium sp. AC04546]